MPVCLRVTGGCWWQGELSHYTVRIRETHGDDWPLQLYRACVSTWSLVVKAVVWVGPYCWLIGSDLGKPAQTRHPASEGSMSLPEYCRSTCRDGWWLEAESQTGLRPLPQTPSPSLRPQISLSPSLLLLPPSPTQPFPSLSLHPHSLPSPPPSPSIHSPPPTLRLQAFYLPTALSPTPTPLAAPGLGKECSCVDCWKDATRTQNSQTQRTCAEHRVSLLTPRHVRS